MANIMGTLTVTNESGEVVFTTGPTFNVLYNSGGNEITGGLTFQFPPFYDEQQPQHTVDWSKEGF